MSNLFADFHIGANRIYPGFILAPMSGLTNSCFRRLLLKENPGAIGLVVTEFISVEGLTRKNSQSVRMMKFEREERPISVQIFGHEISRMVEAAKLIEAEGADIVDINCGCPVPKVVKKGGGCELMRQPLHLAKMLDRVSRSISIPLTLKIRSGWSDNSKNALEIGRIAEENGIQMLAIHGRTRTDLYRGEADWDVVRNLVENLSIPVVGSGDITDYDSMCRARNTGISGVMIGRGSLRNPWIFKDMLDRSKGREPVPRSRVEIVRVIADYRDLLAEVYPEKAVLGRLKQLTSQITRLIPGSKDSRRQLCSAHSVAEFSHYLRCWEESLEAGGVLLAC